MESVLDVSKMTKAILIGADGKELETSVIGISGSMVPYGRDKLEVTCVIENYNSNRGKSVKNIPYNLRHEKVIFNPPATIALWKDGTKTVVKCDERDKYDPKYGMALCFMKKALGNTSRKLNDVLCEVMAKPKEG